MHLKKFEGRKSCKKGSLGVFAITGAFPKEGCEVKGPPLYLQSTSTRLNLLYHTINRYDINFPVKYKKSPLSLLATINFSSLVSRFYPKNETYTSGCRSTCHYIDIITLKGWEILRKISQNRSLNFKLWSQILTY